MNGMYRRALRAASLLIVVAAAAVISAGVPSAARAAEKNPDLIGGVTPQEALRLGARMYRDGILPSGKPMQGFVKGDIPLEGAPLNCASCHLRSGYGTAEGQVRTSPIDGKRLYDPIAQYRRIPMGGRPGGVSASETMRRPAYTDETLAKVMATGVDPAGRQLDSAMPIYSLSDRDMAILVYYLKNLSTGLQPGVTEKTIRFATVAAEDAPEEDRERMVQLLQSFVKNWRISRNMERMLRSEAYLQEGVNSSPRNLSLSVWQLKGPSTTWRAQLEEHYGKDPAFALLGGIAAGDWSPIHRFCEDHQMPCIYPLTEFPDLVDPDWYTLYLSRGLAQESETAARYLHGQSPDQKDRSVIQVFRQDLAGKTLSKAFRQTWTGLGHAAPEDIVLDGRSAPDAAFWKRLADGHKHAVVVLWLSSADFPALDRLAAAHALPDMIIASAGMLGRGIYSLPEPGREIVYITYPYELPRDVRTSAAPSGGASPTGDPMLELKLRALAGTISGPLARLRSFAYRDYFLELIESSQDLSLPGGIYPRLSFGTGQRFASKGCYIVQLSGGQQPELVKRSEWVIH